MKRTFLHTILIVCAGAVLVLPAALNVHTSIIRHNWKESPRWNGQAYLTSSENHALRSEDPAGVAAVLATLTAWQEQPVTEAEINSAMAESSFNYTLAEFTELARGYNLNGQWLRTGPGRLEQLRVPFIAHLGDSGGRFVIVRDARSGYIYAADPQRGNVLYPLEQFTATWTGQVFAFPEPPAQPEEWR
jgi:ABC-type bacteriocin/lantibiotic exporter with double-glycine peptidase domain